MGALLSTLEPESAYIAFILNLTFELAPLQRDTEPFIHRGVSVGCMARRDVSL